LVPRWSLRIAISSTEVVVHGAPAHDESPSADLDGQLGVPARSGAHDDG
jgi:hypothetical protein